MRWIPIVVALFASGCSTLHYSSERPASTVAQCIAERWTNCGAPGYTVPISVARQEQGYFVAFALQAPIDNPLPLGLKHPTYSVWAEVRESASGSVTEYHRAFQFTHERIDRAVQECQAPDQGSR